MEFGLLYTLYLSPEWSFSYKKYGNLYISYEALVLQLQKHLVPFLLMCLGHLCVYPHERVAHVCAFFWVDVCPTTADRDECYRP